MRRLSILVFLFVFGLGIPGMARRRAPGVQALVNQAVKAFKSGRFDRAITLFSKAYKQRPAPDMIFNIARAYEEKGDLQQAILEFVRYINLKPPQAGVVDARKQILAIKQRMKSRQEKAKPQKGWVNIHAPKDAIIMVDTKKTGLGGGRVDVARGRHTIIVIKEGFRSCKKVVDVLPGKGTNVKCPLIALKSIKKGVWHQPPAKAHAKPVAIASKPVPIPQKKPWSALKKALFWSGIGLGVAGLGVNIWAAAEGHRSSTDYYETMGYHDTAKKGYYASIGLYAAGAGLVITALVLPNKRHRTVSIVPVKNGAAIGFATEF